MYGILKDQMKLYLCICEALSSIRRYHGNHICWCSYQLPLISIKSIFENISSKAEQKTTVARTKLAILIQLKVVHMNVSGRTSSFLQYSCKMPKIINIGQRRDTTHTTEATPTTSLPSSRKFWYSLMVKQSFKP